VAVGAIIAVGAQAPVLGPCSPIAGLQPEAPETLAGRPMVAFEVMGRSILQHVVAWLRRRGTSAVSVVLGENLSVGSMPVALAENAELACGEDDLWATVERKAEEHRQAGIADVLVIRLGGYVEFEVADFLNFHRSTGRRVTRAYHNDEALDVWMINVAGCARTGIPVRSLLREVPPYSASYRILRGYVNRLRTAWDLRRLAVDAFLSRCSMEPAGIEIKPGVWAEDGAQIHRRARLVAPVYLGRGVKVRDGALITRFSHLEQDCTVDCGTVVDDASVLDHTYIGQWLDLSHAVVSGSRLVHLGRNVAVEVEDAKLISNARSGQRHSFDERAALNYLWTWAAAGLGAASRQKSAA
jgi:NDP-sugar pyrophosphorylase family protein